MPRLSPQGRGNTANIAAVPDHGPSRADAAAPCVPRAPLNQDGRGTPHRVQDETLPVQGTVLDLVQLRGATLVGGRLEVGQIHWSFPRFGMMIKVTLAEDNSGAPDGFPRRREARAL